MTLRAGHDVAYLTAGQHAGGCTGAMSYYTAAGEPPGRWAGKGAAALGLVGQVDPAVIGRLYQHNIGPGGQLLVKPRQSRAAEEREEAAVMAYRAAHPYASASEVAEVRAAARGQDPRQVPYLDLTVDVVKSVSVLHASYRVAARQACERGDHDRAAALPQTLTEWWRQFETDLAAVDRAIEREQQAAIAAGQPWPPQRTTQAKTAHAEAAAVTARPQHDEYLLKPNPDPGALTCEPAAVATAAFAPQHEPGERPDRLDALQARVAEAVHHIAADGAAREARAHYTARLEREAHAQAEPAAQRQAEASDGIEIEL